MRRAILNLAVRGRLVGQTATEEPASELIKRIQKSLLKSGVERTPLEDGAPFPIPESWRWVRFGQLITDADAGWSPRCETFPRAGDNWGVLKVSAVSWDCFLPAENKQLLPGIIPPERATVRLGDFLISRANTAELVAKCAIVDDEPTNLILSDKIVRLQITEHCSKRFLAIVNNWADYARAHYANEASGTSLSMKNVSREVIYHLPIPLPPTMEQTRIVAKVNEIMPLLDKLEAAHDLAGTRSRDLLDVVLHEVLNRRDSQTTVEVKHMQDESLAVPTLPGVA